MRVVLDTNVLVRAARPQDQSEDPISPAREALQLLKTGPHVLLTSQFLLAEAERVLNYPRVLKMHGQSSAAIEQFIQDYYQAAEAVDLVGEASPSVAQDIDDNPVIQTAVAGKADVLCTLDRHFHHQDVKSYCQQHGIRILSDIKLLQELRSSGK